MATTANADVVHLADMTPRPPFLRRWEHTRHRKVHWVVESLAEAGGTFCYTYFGIGATAGFVLGNILQAPGLGSILQIGFGYGIGIVLALTINAATSGGHFNPCVTIALCTYRGFPWAKAPRYILFQVLGSYIAALLIYVQWKNFIDLANEAILAKGGQAALDAINFTPQGPAGIFALYVAPGTNLNYVLLNEFITDTLLGLTIWACLDPTNVFVPPPAAPWIIGLAYAAAIWGFAVPGLAANAARDVGGRLAALSIWGKGAAGGNYAALAALTNIPAMLFAATIYEFVFADSSRVVPGAQREFLRGHILHAQHRQQQLDGTHVEAEHSPVGSNKGRSELHA